MSDSFRDSLVKITIPEQHMAPGWSIVTPDGRDILRDLRVVSIHVDCEPNSDTIVTLKCYGLVDVAARLKNVKLETDGNVSLADLVENPHRRLPPQEVPSA